MTKVALDELGVDQSELLKIFLLALHLGLRRNEIDKLTGLGKLIRFSETADPAAQNE